MRKFLVKFGPLLINLMIGTLMVLVVGEVILTVVIGLFFREYFVDVTVGYAIGVIISVARLLHMYWEKMGTFFNEKEMPGLDFFSGKMYVVRNALTMAAWVAVLYFLGQTCMLSSMVGTILSAKVAVFMQPITDKFIITKIYK